MWSWTSQYDARPVSLTEDKIIAARIKRDKTHKQRAQNTWGGVLKKARELPDRWMYNGEVLVGTRTSA